MYFQTVDAAFAMAGHGPYVWGAYGLTLLVLTLMIVVPIRRAAVMRRAIKAELRRRRAAQAEIGEGQDNASQA